MAVLQEVSYTSSLYTIHRFLYFRLLNQENMDINSLFNYVYRQIGYDRNIILLHEYYLQYTTKEHFNEEEIRCEAASKIK